MAITFSDFDLSREEDISSGVVTDDAEKDPHEFRDDLSEAEDAVTTEGEMDRVAKIVQVVESLESFREDLLKYEDTDASMSREDAMTLGSRIAFTYANHGVPMDYPIHVSTESMAHFEVNRLEASVEQLDYHIDMLSTEAMGIFEKIKKNVADFFGNEMNKLRRMEKHIDNAIERVQNSDTWATNEIPVAGGSLLSVGGQFNPQKVFSNLEQLIESELKGGIFNTYLNGLRKINEIVGNSDFNHLEDTKKKILSSKLFALGRPFVEVRTEGEEQRKFEALVSDGFKLEMTMPTGVGRLIPEAKLSQATRWYANGAEDADPGTRKGQFKHIKPLSKEEVIRILKDYKEVISNAIDNNRLTSIVNDFIKTVEELTADRTQYEKERKRIEEERKENNRKVFKGWLYSLPIKALCPPLAVAANLVGMADMVSNIVEGLKNDANSHVFRQSANNLKGNNAYVAGAYRGLEGWVIHSIWSRTTMRFQNLAMTFCYSLMRDAYGGIASVGNALIGLADIHIDSKH